MPDEERFVQARSWKDPCRQEDWVEDESHATTIHANTGPIIPFYSKFAADRYWSRLLSVRSARNRADRSIVQLCFLRFCGAMNRTLIFWLTVTRIFDALGPRYR